MDFLIFHHHKDMWQTLVAVEGSASISRSITIIFKVKLKIKPETLNAVKSKGIEKYKF